MRWFEHSFSITLVVACCMWMAVRSPQVVERDRIIYRDRRAPPAATIVDVAARMPSAQLASLVHLAPGEHVVAIGDRAVAGDLAAGAMLAQLDADAAIAQVERPAFIDLELAGGKPGPRRVVLLLH